MLRLAQDRVSPACCLPFPPAPEQTRPPALSLQGIAPLAMAGPRGHLLLCFLALCLAGPSFFGEQKVPFRAHSGLQEIPIATQKDSGVLCFPLRRGLIPRVSLVCNPQIPVAPRDEHNPLQCSCLENPHGQRCLVGLLSIVRKESDTTEVT